MEPTQILPYLSLAISASTLGGLLYNWFSASGAKALKEVGDVRASVAELERQMDADDKIRGEVIVARFQMLENRVTAIEGELKHLPDGDAAHRLELAVEKLTGKLEILEERMRPIAAINQRLQEWVLERSGK